MDKITFENATLVNPAKVTIDGVDYEVTPEVTTGGTPASANTFNTMQSNIEKSVVAVSSTEPSTNEKVWIKKGKNMLDMSNIFGLGTLSNETGLFLGKSGITLVSSSNSSVVYKTETSWSGIVYSVSVLPSTQYTLKFSTDYPDYDMILIEAYQKDGTHTRRIIATEDETNTFTTNANEYEIKICIETGSLLNTDITISSLQLEQGSTATTFEPYVEKEILVKNNNGVFERFADIDEIENSISDTGWIPIQFTSNDWKAREGSTMYAPKFRKIGNIVYLQGQFATNQILNPGTYNIVTTNLPEPDKQHTICTCSYNGKLVNMWIVGKTISLRVFDNNFNDAIGVSIDSCYIELTKTTN